MKADLPNAIPKPGLWRRALVTGVLLGALVAPAPAVWGEGENPVDSRRYSSTDAGHPVKIAYYVVYPVGFLIENLILKPVWWLGQREPFRTVFGVDATNDSF